MPAPIKSTEEFKTFVLYHLDTIRQVLIGFPRLVWAVPFVVFAILYATAWSPLAWAMDKELQEIIAPTVIGVAALGSLVTHYRVNHFFSLIVTIFVCALFLRELHFDFMEGGIYISLIALCWWSSSRRDDVLSFGITRDIAFFFGAALLCYLFADIIDRRTLRPFQFILGPEGVWHHPVEETMETIAHLFNCLLVLSVAWRGAQMKMESTD